jgi:hypothetical protein
MREKVLYLTIVASGNLILPFFLDNAKESCGSGLWRRNGLGGGLGLFGWAGDAEAHEEEAKAFAEGICQAHLGTCLNDSARGGMREVPLSFTIIFRG